MRRPRFRALTARVATIAVAVVIVSTAVYAIDRVMPRPDIMLITRDGRRIEHAAPPPDIAKLRRDEARLTFPKRIVQLPTRFASKLFSYVRWKVCTRPDIVESAESHGRIELHSNEPV